MGYRVFRNIIIILLIFVVVGCGKKEVKLQEQVVNDNDSEKVVEPRVDEKEKTLSVNVGLYLSNNLVSEFESDFPQFKDLVVFDAYFTNDQQLIGGNQLDIWNHYYESYKDIPNLRIGYQIKFTTDQGEVNQIITSPGDVESFFNYIQVYLYDDIHQTGNWYSHVTKEEFNDETIFSSIKLTGSVFVDKITSPVTLVVFGYQLGDKAEPSENNSYQIVIKRK